MKLALVFLIAVISSSVAFAQTNLALAGGIYGPATILGYNNTGDLSQLGSLQGYGYPSGNDGQTTAGPDRADNFGQPDPADGFAGIVFSTPVAVAVSSVTFYDASYFDGGWFGVNEEGPTGVDDSNPGYFSAAALIAPTLQITTSSNPASSSSVWTTVADTNNYVSAMTGSGTGPAYGTPVSTASTFTLDTPVTGITGIRLIGEDGGYHSSGTGGFLGEYEFEVIEVPEPSIYAMLLLGAGALIFLARRRRTV